MTILRNSDQQPLCCSWPGGHPVKSRWVAADHRLNVSLLLERSDQSEVMKERGEGEGEGSIYWAHKQQFSSIIGWCKISCRLKQKSFNTDYFAPRLYHPHSQICRQKSSNPILSRCGGFGNWVAAVLGYYCTKWGNWFPSKTKKSRSQLPSLCVFRFVLCNSCFDKS